MISKDQNIALITVAKAAKNYPELKDYSEYCFDREKGLRKQAFRKLDSFLNSAKDWTFNQKVEFTKFLFPFFETIEDADYGPFPQPLKDKLIKKTLEDWCQNEVSDSRPFRWYGKYYRSEKHILRAIEINPKDDIARETLINWWIFSIYYSVHHLPEVYIGNPFDNIKLANKIREHILKLSDKTKKEHWTNELEEDVELIKNYIDWERSSHPNLVEWGKENNRKVDYYLSRAYYSKKK